MTGRHLILFARAPRLGAVKTRLAREIGAAAALRFHLQSTQATIDRLATRPAWRSWLLVTPDGFAARATSAFRLPKGVAVMGQGAGDLGARMARALEAVPPGPRLLVGTDIPDVSVAHIERAFALLGVNDLVFGPAADGGFWLAGARHRRLPARLFESVRWSTEHTLADTLANLPRSVRVGMADELQDVDDAEAHEKWRAGQ